jgi:predicted alpha/beta-fold hydrolase
MVWRLPGCSATMAGVADLLRQTLRGLAVSKKNEPTSILKALGYSLGAIALVWLNPAAHRCSGKRSLLIGSSYSLRCSGGPVAHRFPYSLYQCQLTLFLPHERRYHKRSLSCLTYESTHRAGAQIRSALLERAC